MSTNHDAASSPAPASAPGRIRRNQACNACRDAKVRCNPSASPGYPCQRCAKLAMSCVVDRTHKRTSRKSKIDELVREIQTIKRSVTSLPSPATTTEASRQPLLFREPISAPRAQPHPPASPCDAGSNATSGRSAPSPSPPGRATPTSVPALAGEATLARALESQPFSAEDIDYYFDKFFTHFHPYLPIVRRREPNACYAAGPPLFWTVVLVACRRYARTAGVLTFLTGAVRRVLAAATAQPPLALPTINALLLAGAYTFPDTRFISDGTAPLVTTAVYAALPLGVHTGRGAHPEFSFGGIFPTAFSDEEAAYTWAGCNIVSQRVSQYMGLPPLGGLFNPTIQSIIDGKTPFPVPSSFRVLLECQKFAHRVSTIMAASLDESRGVSSYLVRQLEDEFDSIKVLICSDRADDMDRFNALLVRLEIQTYYLLPLPGPGAPAGQRCDAARAGATARAVLRGALALDRQRRFLQHAPHWYFRALFTAVCVICTVRTAAGDEDEDTAFDAAVADGVKAARRFVIQDGDLPARLAALLESFHSLLTRGGGGGGGGGPVAAFTYRLGAGITFACVKRWKDELASARSRSHPPPPPPLPPNVTAEGDDALAGPGVAGASADAGPGIDLLAGIDWSLMDDFDWGLDSALTTTGAGWQ